ncbi:MAG TPA: fatty acid desaturase family protein [Phenylobacterium sp.]|jgi:fatty acid desaturase|uniref:fatty acid desaturase family protein n=1 Tax=Phenylobacterium sp. TaxID=1871053 RepID=UPI002D2F2062|nr:fatty acid desaturase family protein [Phenylobacterium sp.]HZZ70428.1 fatty acid desaturase family protein [Phenylobacterium sp.]
MAVAARVDPKSYFAPQEWAPLSRRSAWKGLALLAHAWIVIGLAMALAVLAPWWLKPIAIPLAIAIIGARQLGLAILMHDAAHVALHPDPKVNDWVGNHLTTGGLSGYRAYHLQHHKFAQQQEDPDLALSAPFPITRRSLRRKIVRDLTGQTYYKQRWSGLVKRIATRKAGESLLPILTEAVVARRRFLIGMVATIAVTAPFGLWWVWPVLWLVPQATWLPMVTRLRNIAEHACVAKDEPDPLRHARTTLANVFERAFIAPYYVNYHCEHHMFMHVPCYNLPRAHRLLQAKGVWPDMLTAPGYLSMLKVATSKAA